MYRPVTNRAFGWRDFTRSTGPFATVVSVVFVSIIFFGAMGQAVETSSRDETVTALRDFVQQLNVKNESTAADRFSKRLAEEEPADAAYTALRAFAERIGGDPPTGHPQKFAEADNLLDYLRELNSPSKPSAPSKGPATGNGPVAGGTKHSAPVEATVVGTKACVTCHAASAQLYDHTLMGRIAKTQKGKLECESCHGPGSAHVNAGGGRGVGGIISFRPEDQSRTAEENNAICLACHERGDRTNWHGSVHDTRGLMCTSCHTVMKQVSRKFQLKTASEADTCFQCHKDRRAQLFRSSHMPLREGKMVCSDCHNPHGSFTEALLKKDSVNDTCYTCHAEKRGPFLFEHLPVRENCVNCHDPHGSVNNASLKISTPRLCFECHGAGGHGGGLIGGRGNSITMGRQCLNCHTAVHGSNSPSGGALMR